MDKVTGVEHEVEERVAQVSPYERIQFAASDADPDGLVPLGGAGKVRPGEPLDIVSGVGRQARGILAQPADAARQPAPVADRGGHWIARLQQSARRAVEA